MKKYTLFICLTIISLQFLSSQCTNQVTQWPFNTVDIIPGRTGLQIISTNNRPQNDYSVLEGLVIGESYTIDTNMATPFYITVTEDDGTSIITHGSETVSFVATTTSIYCYWTADSICSDGPSIDTETRIECTSCICTDVAPNAAINPTPIDGNTDVLILYSGSNLFLKFDWEDDLSGGADAPIGYTLYFDNAPNPSVRTNLFTGSELTIELPELSHNTQYYWRIESHNCAGSVLSPIWTFTTGSCSGIGPNQVTSINQPADLATDVNIDESNPSNLEILFDWNAATTGEPATSYILSLGTNPQGNNIGTVNSFDTFYNYSYSWNYDTTYYWFIRAEGCSPFLSTPSPIFSFTTESDPTLGLDDLNVNTVSVYPNPTGDLLQIRSEVLVRKAQVYDVLGEEVATIKGDAISNIDLSILNTGVYFLKIYTNGKTQTIKVVKE